MPYFFLEPSGKNMAVVRLLGLLLVPLIGGYLAYRHTGGWAGALLAGLALGVAAYKAAVGEFGFALAVVLGAGIALAQLGPNAEGMRVTGRASQVGGPDLGSSSPEPNPASKGAGKLGVMTEPAGRKGVAGDDAASAEPGDKDRPSKGAAPAGANASAETQTPGAVWKDCPLCPEMVGIAAGRFQMGSAPKAGAPVRADESPPREVALKAFAAGRYAVTRAQFAAFVKATGHRTEAERVGGCYAWQPDGWGLRAKASWRDPGFKQADDHPVVCVSWEDAQAYVGWLSGLSKKTYRLLSESEREYVTRAGTATLYWWGDTIAPEQAQYRTPEAPSGARPQASTVEVSRFAPNPMGLYQVHGNVLEWTQDCAHDNYLGAPRDGSAWTEVCSHADKRMMRGGSWLSDGASLRASQRAAFLASLPFQAGGFRVARDLP